MSLVEDFLSTVCIAMGGNILEPSKGSLWILGKEYDNEKDFDLIKEDFRSRIWVTYRAFFEEFTSKKKGPTSPEPTGLTSDAGWGCMLRCAQMVFAEAMIRRHLGREWRWYEATDEENYLKIINLFQDTPSAPYSIHSMVNIGEQTVKKSISGWYGPNTVAQLMRYLPESDVWNKFSVVVANSSMLFIDEMRTLGKASHPNDWNPLVVIVPQRLGLSTFNVENYGSLLKKCFHIPECIGIIGGSPSHALFFIGHIDNYLLYLDPHTTQNSATVGRKLSDEEKKTDLTYHCEFMATMDIKNLDPSLAICFLVNKESEFEPLMDTLRKELCDGLNYPLVEILDTRPQYMMDDDSYVQPKTVDEMHKHKYAASNSDSDSKISSPNGYEKSPKKNQRDDTDSDCSDFELL